MNKRYYVKTRNWNCKRWVHMLLNISILFGAYRGDNYTDGDGKYIFETDSKAQGLAMLRYYLLLERFSGGWTYIREKGVEIDNIGERYYLKGAA